MNQTLQRLSIAVLAAGVLAVPRAHADGRARRAELEFGGPLAGVSIETGPDDRLVLHGALAAGEERRAVVLLPVPASGARGTPRSRWEVDETRPGGRVRFVRWAEEEKPLLLPPALRARVRAPVELARSVPTTAALVLLGALACALLGLRSRPRTALGLALGVGLVAAILARAPESVLRAAYVLEGARAEATWVEIRSAAQVLALSVEDVAERGVLEVDPPHAPLQLETGLRGGPATVGRAPRARLHWLRPVPSPAAGDTDLESGRNGWRSLDATWTRTEAGWRAHGPWPLGAALPSARAGADPPGWLCAGLPQGVDVFLGAWSQDGATRHVRVTGW